MRNFLRYALSIRRDARGNVAILSAFAVLAVMFSAGVAIDLARAYYARQQLFQVATLACQYASRPSVIQANAMSTSEQSGYSSTIDSFITTSLQSQSFPYTQTNASPFSYTLNGPANVNLSATVPTTFMQIAAIATMTVGATAHCYDSPAESTTNNPSEATYIISEGFENHIRCPGHSCYFSADGTLDAPPSQPGTTVPTEVGYTGSSGVGWVVTGYCLEVDDVGAILSTVPEGVKSAELDCDNGNHSAGNSAISTQAYLTAGNYELRYFFSSRVGYPDYDPTYLCASSASDLSWANSTNSSGWGVTNALRTNQINVYLDQNTTGSPPVHTTIDGTQQLAGSNLIDMCVNSATWVERSVRIYVSTAGFYWLSFAADGANDSYGGQLDDIRLCSGTCSGTVQDNFPSAWLSSSLLFEDTFDSPTYTAGNHANTSGNLNNSLGSAPGWPNQSASGWITTPYNETTYLLAGSAQGSQSLELDGGSPSPSNRAINRPFLLDPGYYELNYWYISNVTLSGTGVFCTAAPNAAAVASYVMSGSTSATVRYPAGTHTLNMDTNTLGVFMSNGQLVSQPIGGGSLNSQTSYLNPNGSTSTTATAPPNYVNMSSYNASQLNPLLDACGYATSWQARTTYAKIVKPGNYWLTFSALGTADDYGAVIDDVKLSAVGSLAMSSPPSPAVTIPVANPQPAASVSYTGFYIIADPLTFPAPTQ